MADPLRLLREFNINKKEIIERDDMLIFDDFAWHKTTKTNYLMYGNGKENIKNFYTLGCLHFFLQQVHLTHPVYVKEAAKNKVPIVRRPDRRDLLAFLNGNSSSSSSIDKAVPLVAPLQCRNDGVVEKKTFEVQQLQEHRQKLQVKLDGAKETAVIWDNIKSLSEAMSVEKIAAIKAKRLAKKRTTIKNNDDIGKCLDAVMNYNSDMTMQIMKNEKIVRDRKNILQTSGKGFMNVLSMLEGIKIREVKGPKPTVVPNKQPPTNPSMYSRYDQERFTQKQTEGFNIDTKGTYHGSTLQSFVDGTAKLRSIIPEKRNPEPVPKPLQQAIKLQKRISKTPIIIIPAGTTSLINMYNAMDILQDLKFISLEEKRQQGFRRDNELLIQRPRNGHTVPYRIIDNPTKLGPSDWDRVVAVFVLGPTWQFKGYPWKSPVEIFTNIPAFHIKYDEMKLEENVGKWAVKVIPLSRTKRHLDRAALMVFWEILDRFMMMRKRHLRF